MTILYFSYSLEPVVIFLLVRYYLGTFGGLSND